jgi:tetratricopeptide (TPR) repeat protein
MRWERAAAVLVIALACVAANEVAPSKAELAALYQKAEEELGAGHYAAALKELDAIDARQPDLAAVENFRGVVLLRQNEYARAETAFQKALAIDPNLWSARFNLADIPFLQKDWATARDRFAALREAVPRELAEGMIPLVDYKILLTVLFEKDDEKVGAILSRLKERKKSPAFDYAEAAIAFHRGKRGEGRDWVAAATKDFTARENQLYREAFYEVGWLPRPADEQPVLAKFTSEDADGSRPDAAEADLQQAKRAYESGDYDKALNLLGTEPQGAAPEDAATARLRAEILIGQKKFDQAEVALNKAPSADQAAWESGYIRARISLGREDYADATARLESLLKGKSAVLKPETAQLIRYQLFLTLLLKGEESAAQQTMEGFKFTDQTPALYYAQAAWNFRHENPKQARRWIDSAKKLFSEEANIEFARTLPVLASLGTETPGEIAASSAASLSVEKFPPPKAAATTEKSEETPAPEKIATSKDTSPTPASSQTTKVASETRQKTSERTRSSRKTKTRKTKSHRTASSAKATPAATPVPVATPAPTPQPPFLNRLARTLLHTFQRQSPKPESNTQSQPARTEPAKPTATPTRGNR